MNDLFFDTSTMSVHPLAAAYEPWPDAEIAELVADLQQNGFDPHYPIIVDDGAAGRVLLDGRNRLKACQLAGVEPMFAQFIWDGPPEDKPEAIVKFILKSNNQRRHMNAGQRAIMVAIAYPKPSTGGRGKTNPLETKEFNPAALSQARTIVNHAPDLVKPVKAGAMYFKTAFEMASKRKEESERVAADMNRLREEAPDLATIVLEEKGMTAAEAIAALEARKAKEAAELNEQQRLARAEAAQLKAEREQRTALLQRAITVFNPRGNNPRAYAERLFSEIDLSLWPPGAGSESSIEAWAEAAKTMIELINVRKETV